MGAEFRSESGERASVRRRARERAVQCLFGLDFTAYDWRSAIGSFWDCNPSQPRVRQYAERLIQGVMESLEGLDERIAAAVDNWNPARVGRVERNVLRVALLEMTSFPDVPPRVAINEAVEVAKRFGADEAARFVNGVLDRIRSEPGGTEPQGCDEPDVEGTAHRA